MKVWGEGKSAKISFVYKGGNDASVCDPSLSHAPFLRFFVSLFQSNHEKNRISSPRPGINKSFSILVFGLDRIRNRGGVRFPKLKGKFGPQEIKAEQKFWFSSWPYTPYTFPTEFRVAPSLAFFRPLFLDICTVSFRASNVNKTPK